MLQTLQSAGLLLAVAAIVALLSRRLRIPTSAGLVGAGLLLGALHLDPGVHLTKDLVFSLLLPPLIFEGAYFLEWPAVRRDLAPLLALATLGVLLCAACTAAGMHLLAGWEWPAAAAFAVLVSATDPVAVIAVFRDSGVGGRLRVLVEAESLFNDGTAAVLFTVIVGAISGIALTPAYVAGALARTIAGGLACGLVLGWLLRLAARRGEDPLLATTFSVIGAYGAFLLAEHLGGSGVLATLAAGLVMGQRTQKGGAQAHETVDALWEFFAFVANSIVFVLIGVQEARLPPLAAGGTALLAVALVIAARAAGVYPVCALFAASAAPIAMRHQHVLVWGGLRGALALALALSLPDSFPRRDDIVAVTFAVVAFSVFVQGTTVGRLLRRWGEVAQHKIN